MIEDRRRSSVYYDALVNRDSQYNGVFYAGVLTTGIFCIATCRARKPKRENVTFFESVQEALRHGFRPCKICRPTENTGTPPSDIRKVLKASEENGRLTDQNIREIGLEPSRIRRWFRSNMGMTFQAYQRMIRLNSAYEKLKNGQDVTNSAFDAGYESLSGFGYSFRSTFAQNPSEVDSMKIIHLDRIPTPLGPMYAAATETGLCLLEFTDRRMLENEFTDLSRRLKARIIQGNNAVITKTRKQLEEYFDGGRTEFDIPLETPGTPFQQQVWDQLLTIPCGDTRSYKEQAAAIGNPAAVRAVARANGMNRVAIIIPCHRVVGSSGELTGYAGGLPRKRWLLEHERKLKGTQQTKLF